MSGITGREKEIDRLDRAMHEAEAQLIIVYGRRRVGKTYLINEYFDNRFDFQFTGSFDQSTQEQLKNFILEFNRTTGKKQDTPENWREAFSLLRDYLVSKGTKKKQIVFFQHFHHCCY